MRSVTQTQNPGDWRSWGWVVSVGEGRDRQKPDGFVNVDSGLGNSKIALSKNKKTKNHKADFSTSGNGKRADFIGCNISFFLIL